MSDSEIFACDLSVNPIVYKNFAPLCPAHFCTPEKTFRSTDYVLSSEEPPKGGTTNFIQTNEDKMSIPLLIECSNEIRRLTIAGSALAIGDFRLKRLIEPLANAGKTAPVFAKIAAAIEAVVNSTEKNSAEHLLTLSTLINAVLYTQGETSIKGKFIALKQDDMGILTPPTSTRILNSLIQALGTTGSGRYEIITNAHEQGFFNDLRLIRPAINALNDSYGEIADYVAQKVLPMYGKPILKLLEDGLDMKGGRAHARRLEVIHQICGEEGWDLYVEAIEKGSKEIRLSAIKALESVKDKSEQALPLLLDQVKSRNKAVRSAAYAALSRQHKDEVVEILINALNGKDIDLAAPHIRKNRSPRLLEYLIHEADTLLSNLLDKQRKDVDNRKQIDRLLQILSCFQTREDKKTEEFLLSCFAKRKAMYQMKTKGQASCSGKDIVLIVADLLLQMETPKAYEALTDDHKSYDADLLTYAFIAAMRSKEPAYVYENFAPYLLEKSKLRKMTSKGEKILSVAGQFFKTEEFSFYQPAGSPFAPEGSPIGDRNAPPASWDPRWLDAAVKAEALSLVCRLIRPGDQQAINFLLDIYQKKRKEHLYEIIMGLIQAKYSDGTQLLIHSIRQILKEQPHGYQRTCNLINLISLIVYLPEKSIPELEAFSKTLPDYIMEIMLERIAELKKVGSSLRPEPTDKK